jgi:protein-S-isoprenylcysteine O-methyltransferase Ste14
MALIHRISVEDVMLDEEFGSHYVAYRERTTRLLPGIW